jgi:D-alanyl-D-alanine carboxypeptidase
MLRMRNEARYGFRFGVLGVATILAVLAVTSDPVDARSRRKQISHRTSTAASYEPRYADIVVDGNSGTVLHSSNPDSQRHPASLTKIMTLYLLFEQLEAGKLKLDSELRVSERAADQSPTKLGLQAGQTIRAEDAIKGIVTRSANDAAVVVGEAIAGDEETFARLMTRKAQALGMTRTVYRNASGLPDDDQVTTARDQAILGRAIQEHFPRHYRFFATHSFVFRGQSIGNHNHLLGRVEGVDGIKTGYIQSSGFNLVTSIHRDNRYLVAVVLGGVTAGARDERMRYLISENITAAATKRTAPMIAQAGASQPRNETRPEAKSESKTAGPSIGLASANSRAATLAPAVPASGTAGTPKAADTGDPIRPVMVRTLTVRPAAQVQTAAVAPLPVAAPTPTPIAVAPAVAPAVAAEAPREAAPPPVPEPAPARVEAPAPIQSLAPGPGILGTLPARPMTGSIGEISTAAKPAMRSGWMIQVGAYTAEQEAKERLNAVQSKAARILGAADPFTELVLKGEITYYRARFAGLDKDRAEAACKYLKRNDVECMTIKN